MRITHHTDPNYPEALVHEGSPHELADWVENAEGDYQVTFGGLIMKRTNREAQHDGHPAFGFSLFDALGKREVGRLVLLDTSHVEGEPEWVSWYGNEDEALENLAILNRPEDDAEMVSAETDFSYEGNVLDEIVQMQNAHGVTIKIVNPRGPGGGWPVIEITGQRADVRELLCVGFAFTRSEADRLMIEAVTD